MHEKHFTQQQQQTAIYHKKMFLVINSLISRLALTNFEIERQWKEVNQSNLTRQVRPTLVPFAVNSALNASI